MIRRALLIAVALLVVHAAAAQARPFDAEAETDYQEALSYWNRGTPPCGDPVRELLPGPLSVNGVLAAGYFDVEACKIVVVEGYKPCLEKDVVFHETGHSVGLEHSGDPESIMAPQVAADGGPFCAAEFWAAWEAELHHYRAHNLKLVRENKRRLHHAWAVKAPKLEKGRAL